MKIQESSENYLETILVLSHRCSVVRAIDIAEDLGFSKPSVSVAMKNLRENGYILIDDGAISLTDKGMTIAVKIYERHTLLTDFLIDIGVDTKTAMVDACRIEHVISQDSFEALKKVIINMDSYLKKDNIDFRK
ncbi:MAG: metal-dependent transcriptional regulator [Clostridia bacterium]